MGNLQTWLGQAQSQLLEVTFLVQWLIARHGDLESRLAKVADRPKAELQVVAAPVFPEFTKDLETTLFNTQQKLVDYEVSIERLAKGIPKKLEKTGLKMHSRSVALFRGFLILTAINLLATGTAVVVCLAEKLT